MDLSLYISKSEIDIYIFSTFKIEYFSNTVNYLFQIKDLDLFWCEASQSWSTVKLQFNNLY